MHSVIFTALLFLGASPPNPCTNGSFEELRPDGFPADWEQVGQTVHLVHDVHSGQNALRLLRGGASLPKGSDLREGKEENRLKAGLQTEETGLNRTWKAHSGEQGKMIDRLKGGISFWYKAVSAAEGTKLTVQAIPMNADPIEQTDSPRAVFAVPKEHIGDGAWHQGRLKYDFTADPQAQWVHFAARILGPAGELLLDDFSYIEQVGPLLRFARVRLDEDPKKPGERCTISAMIANIGDVVAKDVRANLAAVPNDDGGKQDDGAQPVSLPTALSAFPAESHLGDIPPGAQRKVCWDLRGRRERKGRLDLTLASGELKEEEHIPLRFLLLIDRFGPRVPVGGVAEPIELDCVIRNAGNVIASSVTAEFVVDDWSPMLPAETARTRRVLRNLHDVVPGQVTNLRLRLPADRPPGCSSWINVWLRAANLSAELYAGTWVERDSRVRVPAPSGRLRALSTKDYALLENEHVRLVFRGRDCYYSFGQGEIQGRTGNRWNRLGWLPQLVECDWVSPPGDEFQLIEGFAVDPPVADSAELATLRFNIPPREGEALARSSVSFTLRRGERSIAVEWEFVQKEDKLLLALRAPMLYPLDRREALFPGLEWLVGAENSSGSLDIAKDHPDRDRRIIHPNMVTIPAIGFQQRNGALGLLWNARQKWDGERDRPSVFFASPYRATHMVTLFLPTVPEFYQKWAGECHNPPSYDSLSGDTHHLELWVPEVPEFYAPHMRRVKDYGAKGGKPVRLRCLIFADGEAKDALAAVDEWIRIYGLPEPMALPHGSYEKEIEFSMQAYLKSLWVPETKEWWTSKGAGKLLSPKGRPHAFVADLLLGALVSPDEAVRKQCRERAEEVAKLLKAEPRLDAMRFPGRFDLAVADPNHAARFLATMGEDGAWRFDANKEDQGVFKGMDYHDLGPDGAVEVGTCARNAYEILRYARIAGDEEAYRRVQKTLRLMETFRVPRAAQVWEVPVHTPDLLAAADAVDAYIEAYRFSGDERWLRDAVTWARRGIPFIYLWNPADKPWLLGASIPVYGASWFTCSWFGRPVQWNGLRYATAILKLAEELGRDGRAGLGRARLRPSHPPTTEDAAQRELRPPEPLRLGALGYEEPRLWRRLAELIIRSAILQQDQDGENVALWPDNISAIDGKKCPWVFAPRQIIQNILLLNGRDEEPATTILRRRPFLAGERRVCVTATAKITEAAWDGETLSFKAGYPPGEEGVVLVSNVERPKAVLLDGKPLAARAEVEKGAEPGWRYDEGMAYLSIRVVPSAVPRSACPTVFPSSSARLDKPAVAQEAAGAARPGDGLRPALQADGLRAALQTQTIRIEGAHYRHVDRLPQPMDRIDFTFRRSTEGWMAAHDVADLAVRSGALCGRITGGDPYLVRSLLRVRGDDCPVLLIRLRLTAGRGGQLYWTTESSPGFAEDKVLNFEVQADGQWHEYRLEPARHPLWAGQRITGIRLDPGNGAGAGEFGLAFIRGAAR